MGDVKLPPQSLGYKVLSKTGIGKAAATKRPARKEINPVTALRREL